MRRRSLKKRLLKRLRRLSPLKFKVMLKSICSAEGHGPPKPFVGAAFIASEKEAEARKNLLKEREEQAAAEAAEKAKQAEVLKAKSNKPDADKRIR